MAERFTPVEIQELVSSGDLTSKDIPYLDPQDRVVAMKFLGPEGIERMDTGMGLPPGIAALAAQLPGMISGASVAIPTLAKKAWNTAAPYIGSAVGAEVGQAVGHPWIGAMLGHQVGGKATFSTPSPAPTPKPWGERSAPVAGSKPYGPSNEMGSTPRPFGPEEPPSGPPKPSNLIRQGNVTNPGPNGTGSPSVPSGEVPNPLSQPGWKGPMGNPDNWKPVPKPGPKAPAVERRSPDRPADLVTDMRMDELLKIFGGQPGSRRPPTSAFDEADKQKVMFGGISGYDRPTGGTATRPSDRSPVTKASVSRKKPK